MLRSLGQVGKGRVPQAGEELCACAVNECHLRPYDAECRQISENRFCVLDCRTHPDRKCPVCKGEGIVKKCQKH